MSQYNIFLKIWTMNILSKTLNYFLVSIWAQNGSLYYPNSYQRQGIFASEFHTLFFSIGTDVLNSLIYLVRGKFQRQKIPVPRLGAIQPVSGKTLEPNQRQIQYQNSVGKSEANSELNISKPDLDIIPKNYKNFAERMSFICQFTKKIR